jgi:FkbM family methyltransferase
MSDSPRGPGAGAPHTGSSPPASRDAFSVARRLVHNETQIRCGDPLTFVTPPQRWAYAIELPKVEALPEGDAVMVSIAVCVTSGALGIACVGHDEGLIDETEVTPADGVMEVHLAPAALQTCRSVVLRNTSPHNASTEAQILSIRAQPSGTVSSDTAPSSTLAEIHVDPALFDAFGRWEGTTPAGYWTDWLGVRTSADMRVISSEQLDHQLVRVDRFEKPALPLADEHMLDWLPVLEAVLSAGDCFVMVALGAGWGRWLTAGAFAALRTGRGYRLVGVEAEPTHFKWLERHMRQNKIRPEWCRLMRGAASGTNGTCWFRVGDPAAWYGQSILADAEVPQFDNSGAALWDVRETDGMLLQRVPSYDIEEIVGDLAIVDYMHMDIQGAELDFLSAKPDVLQTRVRRVNVGTHAERIERDLRRLFTSLGWTAVYDIPLNGKARICFGASRGKVVTFGDGVQVWENPALCRRGSTCPTGRSADD